MRPHQQRGREQESYHMELRNQNQNQNPASVPGAPKQTPWPGMTACSNPGYPYCNPHCKKKKNCDSSIHQELWSVASLLSVTHPPVTGLCTTRHAPHGHGPNPLFRGSFRPASQHVPQHTATPSDTHAIMCLCTLILTSVRPQTVHRNAA